VRHFPKLFNTLILLHILGIDPTHLRRPERLMSDMIP
jgi:hypothetical protein